MAKITEYSAATRFDTDDVLLKDGTNGTKKIKASDAVIDMMGMISPVMHRNIFRGKALGSSVTAAQKTAISNGSFDDLFIGDYWTIGGINYTIADMDYFLRIGDSDFNTHHLVIVPASNMYNAQMNETNTTEGAYVGSKMYTENLDAAKSTIASAFGSMVKSHKIYFPNAVSSGVESAGAWVESTVDLMSEIMVYGSRIRNTGNLYTTEKCQLALFRLNPKAINIRANYWLRDVVSATLFAGVYSYGYASAHSASASTGVRPFFPIG